MPATLEATDMEEIFNLEAVVIPDADRVDTPVACGTSDGCAATCASSCVSRDAS